jgi:hypothetical protein
VQLPSGLGVHVTGEYPYPAPSKPPAFSHWTGVDEIVKQAGTSVNSALPFVTVWSV